MNSDGKILVFGLLGQVGGALCSRLGDKAIGLTPSDADFLNPASLPAVLGKLKPSVVINASAYTAVDQAETDRESAFLINADSPGVIATWCAKHNIPFIHYSTDYVYPGSGNHVMNEQEPTGPNNTYGESKLAGDNAVIKAGGRYIIFRTSWVYDATGKNFFRTMLRLAQERNNLKIVADQIGSPTFAGHIADITIKVMNEFLIPNKIESGVYHLCNNGFTSWHEFAASIFKMAGKTVTITPIRTDEYPTPAKRPLNSRLSLEKLRAATGITPPSWQAGLEQCFKEYLKEQKA